MDPPTHEQPIFEPGDIPDGTPEILKDDPEQAQALAKVRDAYHAGSQPLTFAKAYRDLLLREGRKHQ